MESNRKRRGRGEGGVRYDEGRKLWVASVSLGYFPDGRRNRPVCYGKTKKEALDALDRVRKEAGNPGAGGGAALTVSELLDLWLRERKGATSVSTQEVRADAAARLRAAFGGEAAAGLTPLRVSRLYEQMERAGLSASARWHSARALRACLEHAVTLEVLPANPARKVALPAMPCREMAVLAAGQCRALLAASAGYVAGPLLAVALGSGLRQGEQLGLYWADVDFVARRLCVRRALTRTRSEGFALVKTKTKAARRTIALPPFALDALRLLRGGEDWPDDGRTIFSGPSGSHRHRGDLTKHLKKAIRRANAAGCSPAVPPSFRWHDARHTHASLLLSAGHSIRAVSARLGHSSPAFTLRVYGHLMPGDDERLAEGMQGLIGDN